jgi:hypothetical protein
MSIPILAAQLFIDVQFVDVTGNTQNQWVSGLCPLDRLCGLAVKVPGCRTEIYRVSCEVRTEFIYVM